MPLQREERDDQRDHRDERAEDDEAPQRGGAGVVRRGDALPDAEPDGDREQAVVGEHGQRQEVVVPAGHRGQQQHGHHRGPHQRQRDPQEHPQLARAVGARRVEDLGGDRVAGVHVHQVDAERVEQRRQDHRPDRVGEPEPGEHHEGGDHQGGRGHHERAEHEGEPEAPPGEPVPGEAVPGEDGEDRRADPAHERVQRRVEDPPAVDAAVVGEQLAQVAEVVDAAGEPQGVAAAEQSRRVLGAVDHDPPERHEEVHDDEAEEHLQGQVAARRAAGAGAVTGHRKLLRFRVRNRKA